MSAEISPVVRVMTAWSTPLMVWRGPNAGLNLRSMHDCSCLSSESSAGMRAIASVLPKDGTTTAEWLLLSLMAKLDVKHLVGMADEDGIHMWDTSTHDLMHGDKQGK